MLARGELLRILRGAASSLRRDRFAQAAVAAFVLATSLYAACDLGIPLPRALRIDEVPFLFPLLAIAAIRRGLRRAEPGPERRFRHELSAAFACWLVPDALRLFGKPSDLAETLSLLLLAVAYVVLVLAVDRRPHRRFVDRPAKALERFYHGPTVSFFVFALVIYFLFVPKSLPQAPRPEPDGAYLLIVLNGMLAARLLVLTNAARSFRWRAGYALLACVGGLLALSQVAAVVVHFRPDVPIAHLPRALHELAFVILTLAARPQQPAPLPGKAASGAPRGEDLASSLTARTLSFALTFPVLHFAGYGCGIFDARSESFRELVVLICLVLLGALAVIQHHRVERRAEELWLQRKKFEAALSDSQQDLRLILEKQKAEEVQRLAYEKFEVAFQACPYAISINRLDDASFLEINRSFEKALGRRHEDVVGKTPDELGMWSNPGDRARLCRRLEASETVRSFLLVLKTGSGEPVIMLVSLQKIEVRGARAVLTISRELTSQWQQVESLRRPARLLQHVEAAAYAVDLGGRIRHWNQAAERLLGFSSAEVLGREAVEVLSPPGRKDLLDALEGIASSSHWKGEVVHLDRQTIQVRLSGWGTRVDAPGGPYRMLFLEKR